MSKWSVLLALAFAGCVSQSSYDALQADRDLLSVRVSELETKVTSLEADKTRLEAKIERVSAAEAAKAKKIAEARTALGLAEGQKLSATLHTTKGDIRCELWPDVAPETVTNFVGLAEGTKEWTDPTTGAKRKDALYSGTIFHRVIEGFMIQGGDPLGTGRGGPGYRFADETTDDVGFSEPGLLAMANSGPNTNGSQFFVTDSTPTYLDGKHTIFGKCELDVVRIILAEPKKPDPRGQPWDPINPVKLNSIAITRG